MLQRVNSGRMGTSQEYNTNVVEVSRQGWSGIGY
jgi:hypothetical protein